MTRLLIAFMFCILAWGCDGKPLPPGTVARVNGESINLRSVQGLMDSRTSVVRVGARASIGEMRQRYAQATATLIVHALIRQELADRGIEISERELQEYMAKVKEDYGKENWEKYLSEASLREDDWRQLMMDSMAVETLMQKLILPSIRISLDEIKKYYETYKSDFVRPELLKICFGATDNKEEIEKWCDSKNAVEFMESSISYCIQATPREIGKPFNEDLKRLRPLSCSRIINDEGQWRAIALIRRQESTLAPLSENYAFIEKILVDEKKEKAFEEWLVKKIESSKIEAATQLFRHN